MHFLDDNAQSDFEGFFRYRGGRFVCRKQDWFGVKEIFLNNEYTPVIECISDTSSPSVVDLGANIGAFALFIFENFPTAKVVSVEAAPDTYEILQRNQEQNPGRDWKVVQAAVWTQNGVINLDRQGASTGHRVSAEGGDGESISSRRLDDILLEAGVEDIDLLKIDIEGAESAVIPANERIFKRTRVLIIEVHSDRIDPVPVYKTLERSFTHCWEIENRSVQKPVFVLAHEELLITGAKPVSLSELIYIPMKIISNT